MAARRFGTALPRLALQSGRPRAADAPTTYPHPPPDPRPSTGRRHPATAAALDARWSRCSPARPASSTCCPSCTSARSTSTGGTCSLLLRAQPAQRRPAGHVGIRPRRAAHRSLDALGRGKRARRRARSPAGRRRSCRDADRQMPDLSQPSRHTGALLLVPLAQGERAGRACSRSASRRARRRRTTVGDRSEIADAFLMALELFRLRQQRGPAARPRELLDEFSREPGVDAEHLRRPRHLLPRRQPPVRRRSHVGLDSRSPRPASSCSRRRPIPSTCRAARASAPTIRLPPAAAAMRRARAGHPRRPATRSPTSTVTVPLRGCRRALGTIVFDGVRIETGGELDLLDRADELGRAAVERASRTCSCSTT